MLVDCLEFHMHSLSIQQYLAQWYGQHFGCMLGQD